MTVLVPRRKVGHLTLPGYRAGNSPAGDADAVRRGCGWIDYDVHWTRDRHPINTHWGRLSRDKFAPRGSTTRWSDLVWADCPRWSRDDYPLRDVYKALEDAHKAGLNVELEAKAAATADEWRKVAAHAEGLWGDDWFAHVQVKCLTSNPGWNRILHAAHAAGFNTIVLARGRHRLVRIDEPWITYIRGSKLSYPKETRMSWRVARSLDTLLAEINARAPRRSKISDGSIGDAAHASRTSDHNPWVKDANGVGVVRARDFTHDPAGGLDCERLAADLVPLLGKHPALGAGAYIIWNRRIISTLRLSEGWRAYSGTNAHTKHLHLSVGERGYDATQAWGVLAPRKSRWQVDRETVAGWRKKYAHRPKVLDALNALLKGSPKR